MASAKVVISSKVYKSGESPILIQFIVNGKVFTKKIAEVDPQLWDKKKGEVKESPLADSLNGIINKELFQAKEYLNDCRKKQRPVEPKFFFSRSKTDLILDLIDEKIETLKSQGKLRTAKRIRAPYDKIKEYDKNATLHISEDWIRGYIAFLENVKKNKASTINRDLRTIRSIIKKAIGQGKIDRDPFQFIRVTPNKSYKEKLTLEEVATLQNFPDFTPREQNAIDCFLFSLYGRGIRLNDILIMKGSNIQGGRLKYVSHKNKKAFDIELTDKALAILKKYKPFRKYIFPFYKFRGKGGTIAQIKAVDSASTSLRKCLKRAIEKAGIDKNITFHCARHTYAYIALKKGVNIAYIKEFLGHSSINITEVYLREIELSEKLDDQARDLF